MNKAEFWECIKASVLQSLKSCLIIFGIACLLSLLIITLKIGGWF